VVIRVAHAQLYVLAHQALADLSQRKPDPENQADNGHGTVQGRMRSCHQDGRLGENCRRARLLFIRNLYDGRRFLAPSGHQMPK